MYEPVLRVFERAQTCIHQASHGCPSFAVFHFFFPIGLILDGGGGGGGGCLSISVNGYILLLCIHTQILPAHTTLICLFTTLNVYTEIIFQWLYSAHDMHA